MQRRYIMLNKEGQLQAAGHNAQAAYQRLRAKIESLSEEMDDITSPHGIKTTEFDDEDSMVIAVQKVMDGKPRIAAGTGTGPSTVPERAPQKPKRSGTHG